jgi:hypothetical protein
LLRLKQRKHVTLDSLLDSRSDGCYTARRYQPSANGEEETMRIGICGLPQSGKTTIFNALTGADHDLHGYGGGVRLNREVVDVVDQRLDWLHEFEGSKKKTYSQIEYLDVAGLSSGEGETAVSARFITELRRAEALLIALRAFENPATPHPAGSIDPARDLEDFLLELTVVDHQAVTTRRGSVDKGVNRSDKKALERVEQEKAALERLGTALEAGTRIAELELQPVELAVARNLGLLTLKPLVPVLNADADGRDLKTDMERIIESCGAEPVVLNGKLENEIRELEADEAAEFRREFDLPAGALERTVRACFDALELLVFFTVGPKEARAWPVRRGSSALEAAGVIHSDIGRGFIRAEVAAYDDLREHGSYAELKQHGLYRTEGKDYPIADGDVVYFRFQV